MANGLNRVTLLGNLAAEAEFRTTSGGQSVLKFRLATSELYLDRNKQRQEKVEWHSCTIWGKRAEALAQILTKGKQVLVEGSLHTSVSEKDGQKRYFTEIVVREVFLCGGRQQTGERPASEPQPQPQPQRGGGGYSETDYPEDVGDAFPF